MGLLLGGGEYCYEEVLDWAMLPPDWNLHEVADVVTTADDRVCVFNRGPHPVIVFDPGGAVISTWGEGEFTRPHTMTVGPDGCFYCDDSGAHCIKVFSPDGEHMMTLGTPDQPAPRLSGRPFNQPTDVAVDPDSGVLYVTDGYGNGRVHVFSPEGQHLTSWGQCGVEAGQFNIPHNVAVGPDGNLHITDRENHRVQVFTREGQYVRQWGNIHRPTGCHLAGSTVYIGQLFSYLNNHDFPNVGGCITIHDLDGTQLARLGGAHYGEGPGQFTAPHGLAVDSSGAIYVGELSYSGYTAQMFERPYETRCLRKLVKREA